MPNNDICDAADGTSHAARKNCSISGVICLGWERTAHSVRVMWFGSGSIPCDRIRSRCGDLGERRCYQLSDVRINEVMAKKIG